jgi:putative membrane protein
LVLSVDRDDDFGVKTGLNSPFIGRDENIEAALALGIKDAEDSDVNTCLAAIGIYDEMLKKGIDVHLATICGDVKVGYESDLVLVTQLENVLDKIKPDRVVLVSDGAEDEYIYPMIFSRVKVDSVRRVWVKQAPTVEGTYYIIMKMLRDDKMRKRIMIPVALIMAVVGIFAMIPRVLELDESPQDLSIIANMTWGMLCLILGVYLMGYAYKVGERTKAWAVRAEGAVRSGSQMIPFATIAVIFFFMGIFFGYDNAVSDPYADTVVQVSKFFNGVLWMWVFSALAFETGRFISFYLSKAKVYWQYIVASLTILASGFIVQGALDASLFFLDEKNVGETMILLEFVAGFLIAGFGGLLNVTLRNRSNGKGEKKVEVAEIIEYPEA